jgi:hypothetical protein
VAVGIHLWDTEVAEDTDKRNCVVREIRVQSECAFGRSENQTVHGLAIMAAAG